MDEWLQGHNVCPLCKVKIFVDLDLSAAHGYPSPLPAPLDTAGVIQSISGGNPDPSIDPQLPSGGMIIPLFQLRGWMAQAVAATRRRNNFVPPNASLEEGVMNLTHTAVGGAGHGTVAGGTTSEVLGIAATADGATDGPTDGRRYTRTGLPATDGATTDGPTDGASDGVTNGRRFTRTGLPTLRRLISGAAYNRDRTGRGTSGPHSAATGGETADAGGGGVGTDPQQQLSNREESRIREESVVAASSSSDSRTQGQLSSSPANNRRASTVREETVVVASSSSSDSRNEPPPRVVSLGAFFSHRSRWLSEKPPTSGSDNSASRRPAASAADALADHGGVANSPRNVLRTIPRASSSGDRTWGMFASHGGGVANSPRNVPRTIPRISSSGDRTWGLFASHGGSVANSPRNDSRAVPRISSSRTWGSFANHGGVENSPRNDSRTIARTSSSGDIFGLSGSSSSNGAAGRGSFGRRLPRLNHRARGPASEMGVMDARAEDDATVGVENPLYRERVSIGRVSAEEGGGSFGQ